MRNHPTLALAVGSLAATVVLTACSGSDDEPDTDGPGPSSATSGTESAPPDDEPADGDAAVVELLDAGDGERRELRLTPSEGDVTTTDLTVDQDVEITGQPGNDAPAISTPFETEVASVDDDGIDLQITYLTPEVSGGGAQATVIEQSLAGFEGLELTSSVLPTGQTVASEVDVPDDADPLLAQLVEQTAAQLGQTSAPFPDEAVGVGAQWTVTQQIESGLEGAELTFEQVGTYTLTALDGDDYELDVEVEQTVEPGAGGGIDVEQGDGTTSGTITGNLGVVLPLSSESSGTTTIQGTANGRPITVSTRTALELTTETP